MPATSPASGMEMDPRLAELLETYANAYEHRSDVAVSDAPDEALDIADAALDEAAHEIHRWHVAAVEKAAREAVEACHERAIVEAINNITPGAADA